MGDSLGGRGGAWGKEADSSGVGGRGRKRPIRWGEGGLIERGRLFVSTRKRDYPPII